MITDGLHGVRSSSDKIMKDGEDDDLKKNKKKKKKKKQKPLIKLFFFTLDYPVDKQVKFL